MSSDPLEVSFVISKSTTLSVISFIHLGDISISPIYFPVTAPVVTLRLVMLIGFDIAAGSVFTHDVPL